MPDTTIETAETQKKVLADGTQEWWQHDKPHREDGPAAVYHDGTQEWWFEGRYYADEFVFRMMVVSQP